MSVNIVRVSRVDAINKVEIRGDRKNPLIQAITEISVKQPGLYKELSKVLAVELWDGYNLTIKEGEE